MKSTGIGVFRLVNGRVTTRDGRAVVGNLLFAFDKENIGGAYLGSANTNADGAYRIFYDPSLYARPGEGVLKVKEIIDLVVHVYDAAGATLAESRTLHDPAREVRVDLRIGNLPAGKLSKVDGTVTSRSRPGVGSCASRSSIKTLAKIWAWPEQRLTTAVIPGHIHDIAPRSLSDLG